jgi:hypothetical protein
MSERSLLDTKLLNYENVHPSKLRISTHTATCSLSTSINLRLVAENLKIDDKIRYIEYANLPPLGINPKQISLKKMNKKKVFYNQITIVVQPSIGFLNNVKIFNNGSISMTGLKNLTQGRKSAEIILEYFRGIKGAMNVDNDDSAEGLMMFLEPDGTYRALEDPEVADIKKYNIVLINSDYYIGFEIHRSDLHELFIEKYKIFSSYEPCIYPGVNSKFYYNSSHNDPDYPGKCICSKACNGKGKGDGNGNCKKITVAAFQSGSVIITGAQSIEQIHTAYNFVNKVFDDNFEKIKKKNAPFIELSDDEEHGHSSGPKTKSNVVYIKRDNILNMPKNLLSAIKVDSN